MNLQALSRVLDRQTELRRQRFREGAQRARARARQERGELLVSCLAFDADEEQELPAFSPFGAPATWEGREVHVTGLARSRGERELPRARCCCGDAAVKVLNWEPICRSCWAIEMLAKPREECVECGSRLVGDGICPACWRRHHDIHWDEIMRGVS